jgi:hypothetical protein
MTTIHMAPGATVLTAPTHAGLERMTAGVGVLARLTAAGYHALQAWRAARAAAHNQRTFTTLAEHDPRVTAEVRAAQDRTDR